MKTSIPNTAATSSAPVSRVARRKPGADPTAAAPDPKPQKRDNIFSKSRDTREDRGSRQMKTKQNSQTFPHVR